INHAATLAGQYLHGRACGLTRTAWKFPAEFEAQIWLEAFGFFASKLINHKRKADTLDDLKRELRTKGRQTSQKEALRLALGQRLMEVAGRDGRRSFRPR